MFNKIFKIKFQSKELLLLLTALSVLFSLFFIFDLGFEHHNQFSKLSKSFLDGHFYFSEEFVADKSNSNNFIDLIKVGQHYYWHLGPMPAVLFMPLIALSEMLGLYFLQWEKIFNPVFFVGVFWFCFLIARRHNYSQENSLWLAFAFNFASVFQFNAFYPSSWYFSQTMAVFLVFWAIYERFGKRRYWLIGIIFALIFATRLMAGLGVVFFLFDILFNKNYSNFNKKRYLINLLLPIFVIGVLLMGYNYARFDNPFENGYLMINNTTRTEQERFELLNYGLFDIKNIPTNLYYYFINAPEPVLFDVVSYGGNSYLLRFPYIKVGRMGAGFFFIAPFFLYIFRSRFRERTCHLALAPIFLILPLLLTYYYPGAPQLGPRYLLDLLPFAFLLLLFSFPGFKLTLLAKIIILTSSGLNFYLFLIKIFYSPWPKL